MVPLVWAQDNFSLVCAESQSDQATKAPWIGSQEVLDHYLPLLLLLLLLRRLLHSQEAMACSFRRLCLLPDLWKNICLIFRRANPFILLWREGWSIDRSIEQMPSSLTIPLSDILVVILPTFYDATFYVVFHRVLWSHATLQFISSFSSMSSSCREPFYTPSAACIIATKLFLPRKNPLAGGLETASFYQTELSFPTTYVHHKLVRTKGSLVPVSTGMAAMASVTECLFPVLTATSMYDERNQKS